jgi:hypothetical protein
MADSRIKSASEILSAFFDRDLVKQGEYYALFDRSWKNIAGARLASHSRPTEIRHGVLFVETEHQGWMQLLQLQQDRMLDEIQRRFPDLGVRSLAFRLGNAEGLDRDFRRKDAVGKAQSTETPAAPAAPPVAAAEPSAADPLVASPARSSSPLPGDIRDLFEKIRKNIRR